MDLQLMHFERLISLTCALLVSGCVCAAGAQSPGATGGAQSQPWTLNNQPGAAAKPAKGTLRGKVTEHGGKSARIARPGMPALGGNATHDDPLGDAKAFSGSLESNSAKFLQGLKAETAPQANPIGGGTDDTTLNSETESADMVIAWEAWHKRVSERIYELWRKNGTIPGTCYATLTFTRNFHVTCAVQEVELDPMITERMPERVPSLQEEFAREVVASVEPLNGSLDLQFPDKSRRESVSFTPAFRGVTGTPGYSWRKDDFERVQVK